MGLENKKATKTKNVPSPLSSSAGMARMFVCNLESWSPSISAPKEAPPVSCTAL